MTEALSSIKDSQYQDLIVLMEVKRKQIEEYRAETKRMKLTLDGLGLSPSCNPSFEEEPLDNLIDILCEVAFELGVDDLSEAALDLALSDLRLKVAKLPSDTFRRDRALENEKAEKLEAIKALSQSEITLQKAEKEAPVKEAEINQMKKKIVFMAEKQREYSRVAEKHCAALKMSGYRKELSHDAILDLKASLDSARENELKPLKAKLESYRGLPSNLELARAKIAEAEKELEDLSHALTKEFSELHV